MITEALLLISLLTPLGEVYAVPPRHFISQELCEAKMEQLNTSELFIPNNSIVVMRYVKAYKVLDNNNSKD